MLVYQRVAGDASPSSRCKVGSAKADVGAPQGGIFLVIVASISLEGCPKNHGKTGEVDSNLPNWTWTSLESNCFCEVAGDVFFLYLYIYIYPYC